MSKQDSQFFNMFSLVIGILVTVAIVLFALARVLGGGRQTEQVASDAQYVASVEERVRPFVKIAVAGQDNSALAIVAEQPGISAGSAVAMPKDGAEVFAMACQACHGAGIGGAPKAGDKAAWGSRIAQGKAMLYKHALGGYQGKAGMMPAKGGRVDWPDSLIESGVDYMVKMAK
ncbi:MAG: c-type cytochrome [Steroidobacteraceae bacterium]